MKIPPTPPKADELLASLPPRRQLQLVQVALRDAMGPTRSGEYLHWDQLRHKPPPSAISPEEWWFVTKTFRLQSRQWLPLRGKDGIQFHYTTPDELWERVHHIDQQASGRIQIEEEVTNPSTRNRYIVNSLIEEAITSSQLEGAVTTRDVARNMIRSGRKPKDSSEQMILNNYEAIQYVAKFREKSLTSELVLQLHTIVTKDILEDHGVAGRLRTADERVCVVDSSERVLHIPPPAEELPERLSQMCEFANGRLTDRFIHPVVRAIILHFILAYDHPFVDGNGRTARALFYWSMLSSGYWLCEYISISRILKKAPSQYGRAFLYTETDENDLTYFILHQLKVVEKAIQELHVYLRKKVQEVRATEKLIRQSAQFNHRQLALLTHAIKNPDFRYSIKSHQNSHNVVYETARSDLMDLIAKNLLEQFRVGRTYFFKSPRDLEDRLRALA